jgi:hypothetical protein
MRAALEYALVALLLESLPCGARAGVLILLATLALVLCFHLSRWSRVSRGVYWACWLSWSALVVVTVKQKWTPSS